MKRVLVALLLTMCASLSFADQQLKTIETNNVEKLVPLLVSSNSPVSAKIVNQQFDSKSDFTRPVVEIEVILQWTGCGMFSDDSSVVTTTDNSGNINFYTIAPTGARSCQGLGDTKRIYKFAFSPMMNQTFKLGNSLQIETVYTPSPNGAEYLPQFDKVIITPKNGNAIEIKSSSN